MRKKRYRELVVYSRARCHLCEEAMATLIPLTDELDLLLTEIDIAQDDELHKRYMERIPVLVLEGEEIADFFVDEADLRRRVAAFEPLDTDDPRDARGDLDHP
jgi:glutaredoxin